MGLGIEGIGKGEVSRQEVGAGVGAGAAVLTGIAVPVHVGIPQT